MKNLDASYNLFFIVTFVVALILGYTDKVSWWTIGLIFLSHIEVKIKLKRR